MRARLDIHHLGPRVAAAVLAATMVVGSFVLAAPASALSKHVFSGSFGSSAPVPLSNPGDVEVDQASGDIYVADTSVNESQVIHISATGGTFTLSFGGQTTAAIPYNANTDQITVALRTISSIGTANLTSTTTGENGQSLPTVTFVGALGEQDVEQISADSSHLVGGTHSVSVTTLTNGSRGSEILKYTSSGEFLLMFGREVDRTQVEMREEQEANHETVTVTSQQENLCVAASGDICQPGVSGTTPGAFEGEFKEDGGNNSIENRLFLAVDNSSGGEAAVYVGDPATRLVQKFDSAGILVTMWGSGGTLDGSTAVGGKATKGPFGRLYGIAIDPVGNLIVSGQPENAPEIFKFAPDSAFLSNELQGVTNFGASWTGISIDAGGNLYLGAGTQIVKLTESLQEVGRLVRAQGGEGRVSGLRIDPAGGDLYVTLSNGTVAHLPASCNAAREQKGDEAIGPCVPVETFGLSQLSKAKGVAVDDLSGTLYVADSGNHRLATFTSAPYLPDASASAQADTTTSESVRGTVDPAGAGTITGCRFQYVTNAAFEETRFTDLSSGGSQPCDQSIPIGAAGSVTAGLTGLTFGTNYHLRLLLENANGSNSSIDRTFETLPAPPQVSAESVSGVTADGAVVHAEVNPGGGDATFPTAYRVEYGETEAYGSQAPIPDAGATPARAAEPVSVQLANLDFATTYHYRVVATNASGPAPGPDHIFTTFPFSAKTVDACPNAHVRQQTSAAQLLDCRAYELVSAADTAGYDVESNLVPGQTPFGGFPDAPDRVLYGVDGGGIPGAGNPTNHGVDPYVATRGENGWSTEYVGIPADSAPSAKAFGSPLMETNAGLRTFAFGGAGLCSPCFDDGSTGIPVHLPSDKLVQGMEGPEEPGIGAEPEGPIAKHLSADGNHLIFGSTAKFTADGNEGGDLTIYDRNLKTDETHAVSKTPGGATISGPGIAELDVSANGSRVLIGQKVDEDSAHNPYYHLYMDVGDASHSIDLTPGSTSGVLYAGMTEDGSKVFFTTTDRLLPVNDEDESADLYEAEAGEDSYSLRLLSTGTGGTGNTDACDPVANSAHEHWNTVDPAEENCSVDAIGGGGGVASGDGTVYFLSPETLDGSPNGTQNAPNLYVARPSDNYAPHYVTTLESALTAPHPPKLKRSFSHSFGSFTLATGMAVDQSGGYVYVLDSEAQTVEKFDLEGNPLNFTASGPNISANKLTGTPAVPFATSASFSSELAVDQSNGDFYVPDFGNGLVDKFDSSGAYISSFNVELTLPSSVAVNPANGDVYVAQVLDFNTFQPAVKVFTAAGTPVPGAGFTTTIPGSSEPAFAPDAVAVNADNGNVYVDQSGEAGSEVVAYGLTGKAKTLDPSPAHSLAVDPSNGIVYADEGGQVAEYSFAGQRLGAVGSGHLSESLGVAIDPEGNLYASDGTTVAVFSASLAPDTATDNPAVIDAVGAPLARHTADFQISADGDYAAFPSTLSLQPPDETSGHSEVYRYEAASEKLDCVSCTVTGIPSAGDAGLASNGLSLSDDGRVFFLSADQLSGVDTDSKEDIYEWEEQGVGNCDESSPSFSKVTHACLALISAGTSPFDSGLLSASANGRDVYFFTRDSLAPQDTNGPTMKIYDAREGGGFSYSFPPVSCRASDECHGPASAAPGPPSVSSESGTPHNYTQAKACRKGFVRRHGKCVHKPRHRKHHRRGSHHRGGKK